MGASRFNRVSAAVLAAQLGAAAGKTALLVIDVQDCFLESRTTSGNAGSLSVNASSLIDKINQLRAEKSCLFDEVVFSQDYHPGNHVSFGSSHGLAAFSHLPSEFGGQGKGSLPLTCLNPASGKTSDAACCPTIFVDASEVDCTTQLCPPAGWDYAVNNSNLIENNTACTTCKTNPEQCFQTFQQMWTDHCLSTGDATFPPELDRREGDLTVRKGIHQFVDAYSAFLDNTKSLKTELDDKLKEMGITNLVLTGIATDVCVNASVHDAIDLNYTVSLISDASVAVLGPSDPNHGVSVQQMKQYGATIRTMAEVLAMQCPGEVSSAMALAAPSFGLLVLMFMMIMA
jgi:nicotinamidase/pyrazinamidase